MIIGIISRGTISRILVPILKLIKIFYNYKVCLMRTDRLGHLSNNTQLFFIRHKRNLIEDTNYYLIAPSINSSKIANKDLLLLHIEYTKNLHNVRIITSSFFYYLFFYSQGFLNDKRFFSPLEYKSNEVEFSLQEQTVSFTNKQQVYGDDILLKMNITQNDKLVCIYTRDSSFLENIDNSVDWSYHDYRNTNIESYLKTIKFLISKGYKVVRIGSEYSKSLNYINNNFIEYNLSSYKSGFMDLYMPYMASFIIGCKSGATDLSLLFNKPILVTDLTTFVEAPLGKKDLFIQKKIIDLNKNIVPFKELVENEKFYTNDGNKMHSLYGLSYIDNTEDEILEATIEMHSRIINNFVLKDSQMALLRRYHNEYCVKNKNSSEFVPISVNWLEKHYALYLDN